jgi:hypothetical protein
LQPGCVIPGITPKKTQKMIHFQPLKTNTPKNRQIAPQNIPKTSSTLINA